MSPRSRVVALVALAAAVAAALVVGVALLQGGTRGDGEGEAHAPTDPPALQLNVLTSGREADALRAGERAYEKGDASAARRQFESVLRRDPSSIEAAIGVAIAGWPDGTTDKLREIVAEHPDSALARLHLGFALLAEGDEEAAREQWREAESREPDSAAALEAESLLHPDMPRGRPFFITTGRQPAKLDRLPVERRLDTLLRRARSGRASDWLLYGSALQRVGRPLSARAAFDRAVALAPGSVEARTAAAVSRFDKDDPAAAFSRLGPLSRAHPRSPVVRFHLAYLLLWLRNVDEARRQLRLAQAAGPGSFYGREAARLLARLENV